MATTTKSNTTPSIPTELTTPHKPEMKIIETTQVEQDLYSITLPKDVVKLTPRDLSKKTTVILNPCPLGGNKERWFEIRKLASYKVNEDKSVTIVTTEHYLKGKVFLENLEEFKISK
jgi:hypothetical protein